MNFNYGKECGDCENCWMRKEEYDSEIIPWTYDIYCRVDNRSISIHNTSAEICRNFIERKKQYDP